MERFLCFSTGNEDVIMIKKQKNIFKHIVLSCIVCLSFKGYDVFCQSKTKNTQIAFLSDVHLLDIYGEFSDADYKGILNPADGKYTLLRTMKSQLQSTRLFNENYFAFIAALDDVVRRNIKIVALPGDFSDDGQPLNIHGLKKILADYSNKYGIQFIITTGNHDVAKPFLTDSGKTDFLGKDGKNQVIMSKAGMYVPKSSDELPVVITKDIGTMGYAEVLNELKDFGFFPKKTDLYWETPFTNYKPENYSFQLASENATIEKRKYAIPPYQNPIPDLSYLVEPQKGIWLLAIDGNVYIPKEEAKNHPENPSSYNSPNVGYNQVLTHKKHLIDWAVKVAKEAKKRGKTLIAFSHYPMVDFNDDASGMMRKLFGEEKMQLHRVPVEEVSALFAEAGIQIHFAGHMHINDTAIRKYKDGKTLFNIQIPSLAAYIPGYKILTIRSRNKMQISTVTIDSVPDFKTLFPLYEQEYAFLKSIGSPDIWDKGILEAKNYHEFTNWHLKELVRTRFLKNDWTTDFKNFLLQASAKDLFAFAHVSHSQQEQFKNENWSGFDMIFDFYRLHSADELALKDIGKERIHQYEILIDSCLAHYKSGLHASETETSFYEFCSIFKSYLNGAPSDNFIINLRRNTIRN
ncbi:metallophosphoesterase family protein [Flavobacterium daejeonense]|uniref:metallophosphoesterase family protein n=1 Tax=Flavobacterium daejeonense TaxID=350893 RepID=UPI001FE18EF5|nr:metallophosphoesterase [Flavobacterium daejeonense]